jgi:hypothetical protein
VTRAITLAVISLAIASVAAQIPQRDRPRTRPSGTSTITGVVVSDEAEPQPLRRAHVTLQGPALQGSELTTTADDGTFTFTRLPAGRYSVSAAKSAYVTMNYGGRSSLRPGAWLTLDAGETKKIAIRLPRGAVITGVLGDAEGQPVAGVPVVALRYRYSVADGKRQLFPAGIVNSTSDENGVYRIFGLPAGEYVIGTLTRQATATFATVSPADVRAALAEVRSVTVNDRKILSTLMPKEAPASSTRVVMSPAYYPGTAVVGQAAPVTVRTGEERAGIDFEVVPVPAATVTGSLPLTTPRAVVVLKGRDEAVWISSEPRSATVDQFGRFAFPAVVPGRYTVSAVVRPNPGPGRTAEVQWASTDITVDGQDVTVALTLQPAFAISGRVIFEGSVQPLPPMRFPLPVTSVIAGVQQPHVQLESTGEFTITGLVAGSYRLGELRGVRSRIGSWWLKSITLGGRELLDAPMDIQRESTDAVVTFADRATELSGVVRSTTPGEQPGAFVIAFATDHSAWFHNSRRVAGVRPDAEGRYAISNLPPGDYFVVVDDNVDPNEWFDPAVLDRLVPRAVRITLGANETRSQDFVIR